MADKATQLVVEALSRAMADPIGLPLHGSRSTGGLFPATPAARQAAKHCKEEGMLRPLRTEARGKTKHEICTITDKGLAFLLNHSSPQAVLEVFVEALKKRNVPVQELAEATRNLQTGLDSLRTSAGKALEQLHPSPNGNGTAPTHTPSKNGVRDWRMECVLFLQRWQQPGDCPLPVLYHHAQSQQPQLTIGQFHDGLRSLFETRQIYLHPWTGPLYDMPEPALALLVGHEIAYYASCR